MDYNETYWTAYQNASFVGACTVLVDKRKYVDTNNSEMNLHSCLYRVGPLELNCMVKEDSEVEPVKFSSYCILKNFRHKNVVSVHNFYLNERHEERIVVAWVDQTLRGWLMKATNKLKVFELISHSKTRPSNFFRNMIIEMCAAVESMVRNGIYPKSIRLNDIYLLNTKGRITSKILVSEVVDLYGANLKSKLYQEGLIWADLKAVVKECCRIAAPKTRSIHPDSKKFLDYIGKGTSKELESYPDTWNDEEKMSYFFYIMSGEESAVKGIINGISGFAWPEDKYISGVLPLILRQLKDHQEKKTKLIYDTNEPSHYLWLCRNALKHWASLPTRVKGDCKDVFAFLRKMEMWSPGIWCRLYEAFRA